MRVGIRGTTLETFTDSQGFFRIENVPVVPQVLEIDGSQIGPFAHISIEVNVLMGPTLLPRPIFLSRLDPTNAVPVPLDGTGKTTSNVTVTSPDAPGVSLQIPTGSTVIFPPGWPKK